MEDWDEALFDSDDEEGCPLGAIPAAQEAAATPVTRAVLDICSRDMEFPFSGSTKAMARLLDIAILTVNQKAAVNLSKKCQLRPLRRWAIHWDIRLLYYTGNGEDSLEAARTALWAGANLQGLMVHDRFCDSGEDIPFPQALFLKPKLENWQEIRHLLPRCHGLWSPRNLDNKLAEHFFEVDGSYDGWKLSLDKIRAAEDAGLDLRFVFDRVYCYNDVFTPVFVTLLDFAIWCGQPDCAEACVDRGIELKGDDRPLAWHKDVVRGESLRLFLQGEFFVPSEEHNAAAAAGRAWLKRLWKSESSQKGIVLYQMMVTMFKGRPFPMALVQEILTFSMPVPKIIDQLDLWERVGDWMTTICSRPTFVHAAADCNTADVEEPEGMQHNDEAGRLLYIGVLAFVLFPLVAAKHQDSKWEPFLVTIVYYLQLSHVVAAIDKVNDQFHINFKKNLGTS